MSFIYPECPGCGEKQEDGISLEDMEIVDDRQTEFHFECEHCGEQRHGRFEHPVGGHPEVTWYSDPDETGLRSGKGLAWFSKLLGVW